MCRKAPAFRQGDIRHNVFPKILQFAVTSDGVSYPNHKYLAESEKKLARLQRQLSRKSKGSRRGEKARIKVAVLYEHIANQRQDAAHKLSTQLIRENDVICIEDLAPKKRNGMGKPWSR